MAHQVNVELDMTSYPDKFVLSQLKYYKWRTTKETDEAVLRLLFNFHDQYAAEAARRNLKE